MGAQTSSALDFMVKEFLENGDGLAENREGLVLLPYGLFFVPEIERSLSESGRKHSIGCGVGAIDVRFLSGEGLYFRGVNGEDVIDRYIGDRFKYVGVVDDGCSFSARDIAEISDGAFSSNSADGNMVRIVAI